MPHLYPWLKAFHAAAAFLFIGGVLAENLLLLSLQSKESHFRSSISRFLQLDRMITTPSMLVVWAIGLTLGSLGNWFFDGWLLAKLLLVLALSAVHGVQLRELRKEPVSPTRREGKMLAVIVICAAGIAVLVIVKPF